MRFIRLPTILSFGLVAACCFLCHCSARPPKPLVPESDVSRAMAHSMLQSVLATNAGLDAIKGKGRVRMTLDDEWNTFRAAWIGKQPDQFRLDVLSPTLQPILSFACDGNRIYLLSYSDNRLYRRRASENSLERIIAIDMTVEDFLDLISGRLPVHQGGNVRLEESADSGPLLVLDDKKVNYTETILLDIDRSTVREFERRKRDGTLLFRVLYEKRQDTEGFTLPESMSIHNDNGRMIHITVERTWVNPELTDDKFVLKAS